MPAWRWKSSRFWLSAVTAPPFFRTGRATALITDGPFAKSRNPIYTGNTLLVTGAGLLFGLMWLVAAGLIAAFVTQKLAIEREERHLEGRFGVAWKAYAARTPRWLIFR